MYIDACLDWIPTYLGRYRGTCRPFSTETVVAPAEETASVAARAGPDVRD